jgi:hypothetical protein
VLAASEIVPRRVVYEPRPGEVGAQLITAESLAV